ncbi:hypothetical protein GIB67_037379 [Kingdonia uniflora]|uniref:5-methyltetrahydropteroyltriglutamate--homocysteine S-methyltransferase n=1 Tax=Kingdonia uniflora TaxID=39325 RepID=A0A7J7M8F5_9MAGN|nr:hypothetical protein GIB67_037379 [Kingdonia uniflora]
MYADLGKSKNVFKAWICIVLYMAYPVQFELFYLFLVGPVSYLLLSKPAKGVEKSFALLSLLGKIIPVYKEVLAELKAVGATWVQIDELILVMDLDSHKLKAFTEAYEQLEDALSGFSVIIETYFADLLAEAYKTIISLKGIFAIGLDLVRGDKTLELVKSLGFPSEKYLFAGVVDVVIFGPMISKLLSLPSKLLKALLAKKILEVNALAKALAGEKDEAFFSANAASQASRKSSPRVNDEAVQKAASTIRESEHRRGTPVTARLDAQQKNLNLSILLTTTIGSFPQTPDLRRIRREYKANKISEEEYIKAMKKEISLPSLLMDGFSSMASTLSRGYPASVNACGATTAGLTDSEQDNSDDEHDNNEGNPQVVDNGPYCAYPAIFNCGNNNFDIFELENPDENQYNQEKNKSEEFEDPHLEDLYAQTLAKCIKLGKLNKVLKDQINTLTCELQGKTKSTSHEIEVLENEKQGLHNKVVFLEKEVNDAKEKMKSTLDELRSAKLDVVLSQQKLEKFCHGAMNIDKMLCMGKTDSDKRGLGYEEFFSKAKTPQITKFVKATASISMPKHNVISTTQNHSKRASYSRIYYCSLCG